MNKIVWRELKSNLIRNGYEQDMIKKDQWGTFWQFAFKKNLKIKKGAKGVKVQIQKLRFIFIKDDKVIYEINNKGLKRPKFRVTNFKKSFFHVSQTEPRNTHWKTKMFTRAKKSRVNKKRE